MHVHKLTHRTHRNTHHHLCMYYKSCVRGDDCSGGSGGMLSAGAGVRNGTTLSLLDIPRTLRGACLVRPGATLASRSRRLKCIAGAERGTASPSSVGCTLRCTLLRERCARMRRASGVADVWGLGFFGRSCEPAASFGKLSASTTAAASKRRASASL